VSDVYWDAIFALPYSPTVVTSVGAVESVAWLPTMSWTKVGASGAPAPRQGHTMVSTEDGKGLILFGGERSGYYYGDAWRYTVATDTWTFITARGAAAVLPRADHSAIMHGATLVVFGGRGPQPCGDLWTFNTATASWLERETPPGLQPRFGHTAVSHNGKMYVLGGYVGEALTGKLALELWALDLTTYAWEFLGPHEKVSTQDVGASAAYSVLHFPSELPKPRVSAMGAFSTSTNTIFYLGGAGGLPMERELGDTWQLELSTMSWQKVEAYSGASKGVARAEATLVTLTDGHTGFVFGGAHGGTSLSDNIGGSYLLHLA